MARNTVKTWVVKSYGGTVEDVEISSIFRNSFKYYNFEENDNISLEDKIDRISESFSKLVETLYVKEKLSLEDLQNIIDYRFNDFKES
jgi:hypothetical protein